MNDIEIILDEDADLSSFPGLAGAQALILTAEGKILLQERDDVFIAGLPLISQFGGGFDVGETFRSALIRELAEELGAKAVAADLVWLGSVARKSDKQRRIAAKYFWHDKNGTISGCYEGKPSLFDSAADALALPNLSDSSRWMLEECVKRGLIK